MTVFLDARLLTGSLAEAFHIMAKSLCVQGSYRQAGCLQHLTQIFQKLLRIFARREMTGIRHFWNCGNTSGCFRTMWDFRKWGLWCFSIDYQVIIGVVRG